METTLTPDIYTIAGLVIAAVGIILSAVIPILFWMNSTINRRFDDAQRSNDRAHAHIGENIKSLERQLESGLRNVHVQLAAITPRAMAAPDLPDTASASDNRTRS